MPINGGMREGEPLPRQVVAQTVKSAAGLPFLSLRDFPPLIWAPTSGSLPQPRRQAGGPLRKAAPPCRAAPPCPRPSGCRSPRPGSLPAPPRSPGCPLVVPRAARILAARTPPQLCSPQGPGAPATRRLRDPRERPGRRSLEGLPAGVCSGDSPGTRGVLPPEPPALGRLWWDAAGDSPACSLAGAEALPHCRPANPAQGSDPASSL